MRLLIIEDEDRFLSQILPEIQENYLIDVAYNGEEGAYMSEVNDYDVIIIDSSLPDIGGDEVCRRTRSAHVKVPILCLTEDCDEAKNILLLDAGADAYISKPINNKVFRAKLSALLRRCSYSYVSQVIQISKDIRLDTKHRELLVMNNHIHLRRREYDILEYLAFNKGRVVTKEQLLEHIWRDGMFLMSNTVEVHIKSIRDKIDKPYGTTCLRTVRGYGYKLCSS